MNVKLNKIVKIKKNVNLTCPARHYVFYSEISLSNVGYGSLYGITSPSGRKGHLSATH